MKKKLTVLLMPPMKLPIPDVGGGATEKLITNLFDVNEKENKIRIISTSVYDKEAAEYSYNNSKVYYFQRETMLCNQISHIKLYWKLYLLWLKIFRNHIVNRFFKSQRRRMNFFEFQCYVLAKKEHVDIVINEDIYSSEKFDIFNYLLNPDRVFYHVHYEREENLSERKVVRNSISISKYIMNQWVRDKSIPGMNVVLYNGIDIKKFDKKFSAEERSARRKELGIKDNEFLVIFCGRLVQVKGVKELLDAFEKLQGVPVKLLLIGSVGFSASITTDFSKEIIKRAEESSNVIYLGYIPNNQMPDYYALADIQVIPSIWQEGAGLASVEGMASGLPLIVTKSGGMIEYVNEESSLQLPIDDKLPDNIAEAIKTLINDEEKRKQMGAAGRKRAELFSREKYYSDFVDICEQAVNK